MSLDCSVLERDDVVDRAAQRVGVAEEIEHREDDQQRLHQRIDDPADEQEGRARDRRAQRLQVLGDIVSGPPRVDVDVLIEPAQDRLNRGDLEHVAESTLKVLHRAAKLARDGIAHEHDGQQDRDDDEQGGQRRGAAGAAGPGHELAVCGVEDNDEDDRPEQDADEWLQHQPAQPGGDAKNDEQAEASAGREVAGLSHVLSATGYVLTCFTGYVLTCDVLVLTCDVLTCSCSRANGRRVSLAPPSRVSPRPRSSRPWPTSSSRC